ncbi:MAG: beta-CASP ribonuclease aCPSF1 [Candidatus Nanohaloarchaeota archaeon QJJ-9]|nr:beta-CASP ribonuclease aCPSF1 [Candidatus Nanohaloarchaeota archaeon QJJ-9]
MSGIEEAKELLPQNAMIQESCYEASDLVFYTKNKEFFLNNEDTVKKMVSKFKKRVEIRPASNIRLDPGKAKKKVKKIVPDEAGLKDIVLKPSFGKIVLQAKKPGLVIGKSGSTLEKIKKKTRWMPEVERVPAIDSKIVDKAREIIHEDSEFRKDFLDHVGKNIRLEKSIGDEWIRATGLGGFRQVGRSSVLLQTEESNILLDCGIDASKTGKERYPHLDVPELDFKALDAVIVTHAHLDHCGAVPYLFEYGYDGPVYVTEPTRDLMILLQLDLIDVARREGEKAPYDSSDIKDEIKHTITLDYDEVADITQDMRLTFKNAGHILGSAAAHLHVGEGLHNIVYTGDIKYDKTELLRPADPKFNRVETLVMESTYGGDNGDMPKKKKANKKFKKHIRKTLKDGGKVIIPSFAVGRAQEIMLLIAQEAEKDYFDFPVYLDGMIWDATALHTAYPEYLSKKVQKKIFNQKDNPFLRENFHRVGSQDEREDVIRDGPAVILATSGMVTGGPIISYLENLAEDEDNTLMFVGYQASNTKGREIQSGRSKVTFPGNNKPTPMNLNIATIEGFSAHSSRNQLLNYVSNLPNKPKKILCQHGDNSSTFKLSSTLHKMLDIDTSAPQNLETLRLH